MEREYDGAKLDEFGMELVVEIVYGKHERWILWLVLMYFLIGGLM